MGLSEVIAFLSNAQPAVHEYVILVARIRRMTLSDNEAFDAHTLAAMLHITTEEALAKLQGDDMFNAYEILTLQAIAYE